MTTRRVKRMESDSACVRKVWQHNRRRAASPGIGLPGGGEFGQRFQECKGFPVPTVPQAFPPSPPSFWFYVTRGLELGMYKRGVSRNEAEEVGVRGAYHMGLECQAKDLAFAIERF